MQQANSPHSLNHDWVLDRIIELLRNDVSFRDLSMQFNLSLFDFFGRITKKEELAFFYGVDEETLAKWIDIFCPIGFGEYYQDVYNRGLYLEFVLEIIRCLGTQPSVQIQKRWKEESFRTHTKKELIDKLYQGTELSKSSRYTRLNNTLVFELKRFLPKENNFKVEQAIMVRKFPPRFCHKLLNRHGKANRQPRQIGIFLLHKSFREKYYAYIDTLCKNLGNENRMDIVKSVNQMVFHSILIHPDYARYGVSFAYALGYNLDEM